MSTTFKVLVVDDSPTQQLQIQMLLENDGYQVLLAANGLEALEVIGKQMPDIVVTDLQMPEMNGLELVSEIKSRYPTLPVILSSGYTGEALAAVNDAPWPLLKKPYSADALAQALGRAVDPEAQPA